MKKHKPPTSLSRDCHSALAVMRHGGQYLSKGKLRDQLELHGHVVATPGEFTIATITDEGRSAYWSGFWLRPPIEG